MSISASSERPRPIRRDAVLPLAGRVVATTAYILAKWIASPVLLIFRRVRWRGTWPRRLDAAANLACLPLTETPDRRERQDVTPSLAPGDLVPDVPVSLAGGKKRSLRSFAGRPLLLALVRGNWCSYSRMHLTDLCAAAPRLTAAGVELLAVSSHAEEEWWGSHGVTIPIGADPDGALFRALGVRVDTWLETAWGRVLPHESVFLFDASGRLVAADVRRVSSTRPGQTFLSADYWVELAQSLTPRPS
jgi:peroxiredoxin